VRCFVAIDVSPGVRAALADAQGGLRAAAPGADVRWVDPAQLHLTLQFLGQVPDPQVVEIAARLATVAAGTPAIDLAAAGLGAFPTPRRARVVWAGVTVGVAELAELAKDIGTALAPLGFPPEERPFRAHTTLGRVRSPRGLGRLASALERAASLQFGSWTARELVLYQSRLRPTGALYEAVARAALRGAKR
jgi:2'-5' RNA ligase